ncbi:hypothetical protein OUZ56_019948 [Daphnia magna]|uniref:Uncharacterized protein n=1 Tax=Daphnia magna TaxID=35525 RepID=A0ABQ9ZD32_9CRUS|nr:hypothetical protein OUZ56_019948 [Daphnia magna]
MVVYMRGFNVCCNEGFQCAASFGFFLLLDPPSSSGTLLDSRSLDLLSPCPYKGDCLGTGHMISSQCIPLPCLDNLLFG